MRFPWTGPHKKQQRITMESHRKLIPFLSRWIQLILIISCLLLNPSSASSINGGENEKVTLVLYYETLCPYCSNLIVNYLYKLFDNGLIAITQLKLVPYGNAKISANGTITCQQDFEKLRSQMVKTVWSHTDTPSNDYQRSGLLVFCHESEAKHCFYLFSSRCLRGKASVDLSKIPDCNKVSVGLYYETLCPYSANFIIGGLAKIFSNGLSDIVDLKLFPWGNAILQGHNTFICQHGQYECLLNTIEACAIDIWPDVNEHFPFIYCVESLVHEEKYTQWETCFEKLGLDPTPVTNCYKSGRGKELELGYAAETNALNPPHKYVPWVVVDGQPLYEDYQNFTSYICKAYKGTPVPPACSEYSVRDILVSLLYKANNPVKAITQAIRYNIM